MATAKWTLMGMYNYDNTIFNEMILPTGIDADLFKSSLLIEKGEFEVLFPDPDFMKNAIKVWSAKWYRTFSEWLKGTQAEWNPIYNYDRYEEGWDDNKKKYSSINNADYSDKRTADLQDKHVLNTKDERTADTEENRILNTKDARTADLKDESTFNNTDTTSQTKESTTEHKVAAYDSSSYVPSSQDIVNNGDSKIQHTGTVTNETTGTDTTAHSGSDATTTKGMDTTAHTGSDTINTTGTDETVHKGKLSDITGDEQNTNQHTAHLYGNIGVSTSASILAEFYQVAKWNLYEHMADVFGSELLIQVY